MRTSDPTEIIRIPKTALGVPPRHHFPKSRLSQVQLTFTDETEMPYHVPLYFVSVSTKYAYYSTVQPTG